MDCFPDRRGERKNDELRVVKDSEARFAHLVLQGAQLLVGFA